MKHQSPNTAILFFSRTAKEEDIFKKVVPGRRRNKNQAVFESLIEHSISLISNTGLKLFKIGSADQSGESFGEKYANAIQQIFDQGYKNIISIGNDCPTLSKVELEQSIRDIEGGKNVLGPALDGGIYLLGINKSAFDKKSFTNLSWQTGELFQDILSYFEKQKKYVSILQEKSDVDSAADLSNLLSENSDLRIVREIKKLLSLEAPSISGRNIDASIISQFHQSLGLRGPPRKL